MKKILPFFLSLLLFFSSDPGRAGGQTPTPVTAEFERLVSSGFKADGPGGVVLVARGGRVIYKKAFGMANLELGVPMKEEMIFNVASITKQFTAVAVLQLAERGKLSLQDEVTKYLPDYAGGQKITVENLLTHTAGIPASAPEAVTRLQGERRFVTLPEIIDTFRTRPPEFEPGTRMAYSNNGYMLLGAITEKVSGTPYAQYLEKNLFGPAGMTETRFGDDYQIVRNRAASYLYSRADSRFFNAQNGKTEIAFSAGAVQSTAGDLFKWNRALVSHKLIKRESLEKAQTPYRLAGGKSAAYNYGYGWFIGNIQGSPLVEHGGNMGGFMSHAIYLPREDVFVAVLYNFRAPDRLPEFLAGDLAALAIGKPFDIKEVSLGEDLLRDYAGVYVEEGVERLITVEKGKLYYRRAGANKMPMKPYAEDKFFFENTAIVGEFKRDAAAGGRIVSLELSNKRGVSSSSLKRTDKPVPPLP